MTRSRNAVGSIRPLRARSSDAGFLKGFGHGFNCDGTKGCLIGQMLMDRHDSAPLLTVLLGERRLSVDASTPLLGPPPARAGPVIARSKARRKFSLLL